MTRNRWAIAVAGTVLISCLGIGAVIGGRWQDRAGLRVVAVIGVVVWGLGNILAGLGTARLGSWWIYLTYGVMGGLGLGLAYITPVAAVTKWFPDKRGLGSGMVVMGFGLGAFFYNNIVKTIPSFSRATREAAAVLSAKARGAAALLSPESVQAVMSVF